jgi:hypothetical protein
MKLSAHPVKTGQARLGLPGNVDVIIGSAFFPAPAYRQEGGAFSRLAREGRLCNCGCDGPPSKPIALQHDY